MNDLKVVSINGQLESIERLLEYTYNNPTELGKSNQMLDEIEADSMIRFPYLRTAIGQVIAGNFLSTRETEFDKHKWFVRNHKALLGNAYELTKRPNNPRHIPDFWMKINHEYIPVEIKLKNFTNKSLKQLQRYMSVYKCESGIAVAEKLNCSLPQNIRFISFNDLEGDDK